MEGYPIILWSTAEIGVTIIASSIPTLRVLIRDVATSASSRSRTNPSQHPYAIENFSRAGGGGGGGPGFPAATKHATAWATDTEADDTVELQPIRATTKTPTEKNSDQVREKISDLEAGYDDGDDNITYDRRARPSVSII